MITSKKIKQQNIIQLIAILAIIVTLNVLSQFYFGRFDLTSEKRFSVSPTTQNTIENIDDIIYIKVFLEGDLPSGFKRLKNSTKELLDEFRAYNNDIMYEFINPSENENKKERFKFYKQLASEGLAYYNIPVETKDGFAQKTVFPSMLISYKERTLPVNLLIKNQKIPNDADLNNSVENLELTMVNAIRKISQDKIPSVVFTTGHGELDSYSCGDLAYELTKTYEVGQIKLDAKLDVLMRRVNIDSNTVKMIPNFDLVIIAKPQEPFNMKELFILDQYVMHGGKIIWAFDNVYAEMDSLRVNTSTIGIPIDLKLNEILFHYGARVNNNLVLNRNCMEIGTAEGILKPWHFFPLALPAEKHIATKNINSISTHFVNNIDLVGSNDIKKTVLLKTDRNTRIMPAPVLIDLVDIIYRGPNPALYNQNSQNIAVLLEGEFNSYFKNRMLDPRIMKNLSLFDFKEKSKSTSQLIISDGDILKNQLRQTKEGYIPLPLGYDKYSKKMYDNRKFMLNAINYMLEDEALIHLRNKQYKIRLLNKERIAKERTKWQIINTVTPIIIILILGLVISIIKRKKYVKNKS